MPTFPKPVPPSPVMPAPGRSRYAGIRATDVRDPMLLEGVYRVRITNAVLAVHPVKRTENHKISMIATRALNGGSPVGMQYVAIFSLHDAGLKELKRLAVAAMGYAPTLDARTSGVCSDGTSVHEYAVAGEAAYDAAEETSYGGCGAILEASVGLSDASGAPTIVGCEVDVIVARGKDIIDVKTGEPTGDWYRSYTWCSVGEAT